MNTLSIDTIKKEINDQGFKHVGLFNQNGESIVPYNNSKVSMRTRLTEIEKRLKSNSIPDGIYLVQAKNSLGTRVKPSTFYYAKGNVSSSQDTPQIIIQQQPSNNGSESVITYESALALQTEIVGLKMKVERLEQEKEDLENQLAEYEEQHLSDGTPSMLDSAKSFLMDSAPMFMPIVEKWFEQRDRQLSILEKKLDLSKPRQQQQRPQPQKQQDPAAKFIHYWDGLEKPEEETEFGPAIADAYNRAKTLDEFEQTLLDISPEIHEQYIKFINHGQ